MEVKKTENKVQYSTRLRPSVIEKLKKQAKVSKVSVALVIETLVDRYVY